MSVGEACDTQPGLRQRGGAGAISQEGPVYRRAEESGVRVSVHEGVDLQLCLIKDMGCRVVNPLVDHLPYSGIQTHLEERGAKKQITKPTGSKLNDM